jgi:hypothetical protein
VLPAPFGVLPLVALIAVSDRLCAATFDPRQFRITIWYSGDDGETWVRSLEASTEWPVVASSTSPASLSIGNVLFLEFEPGNWKHTEIGQGGSAIYRIQGARVDGQTFILALTTTGILRSEDLGETWQPEPLDLPVSELVDISVDGPIFSVLLTGGRIWQRDLRAVLAAKD